MKKIAVLGAGMVGKAIALDLATNFEVTAFDRSETALQQLATNGTVQTQVADLSDHASYNSWLKDFDAVVLAVPGFMGYACLEAVIRCGKDVVDISFFPENALELDELAKEHKVTAIVDCGVAPGLSNLVLGYEDRQMQVEEFECMVGGLPKLRKKPFEYKAPFSPIDVIEEYTRPARLKVKGEILVREALSDIELVEFRSCGTLESFNTDGLRSLLWTMPQIPSMREKTLRYPGHADLIIALKMGGFLSEEPLWHDGRSLSPLKFTTAILINEWKSEEDEKEFTVMRIEVKGKKNGQPAHVRYDLYDEYDEATGTSSMARTTAYTCTAAVNLMLSGLFQKKGIYPPELIGSDRRCFSFILQYLAERNIRFEISGK